MGQDAAVDEVGLVSEETPRLMTYLQSPAVVPKTLALMRAAKPTPAPAWGELVKRNDGYGGPIERMLEHQSKLSSLPQARQLLRQHDIHIDESWLFIKGRLFYPHPRSASPADSADGHLRGFWTSLPLFSSPEEDASQWLLLERREWFAPLVSPDTARLLDKATLVDLYRQQALTRPICVAGVRDGLEIQRGFLVPDDW